MARTKEFDKDEVLEKAKQLFWKQGFHATSIQNLVDYLGISRASIYDTFGGKNELYETAFQAYQEENLTHLKNRLAKFTSIKKGLKTLFQEAMSAAINDDDRKGCFVINCTTEYLPKHEHILLKIVDNRNSFLSIVSEALQRGKDSGELAKNLGVKDISAYLFTFFSGLQIIAKVNPNKKELFKSINLGLKILD